LSILIRGRNWSYLLNKNKYKADASVPFEQGMFSRIYQKRKIVLYSLLEVNQKVKTYIGMLEDRIFLLCSESHQL
jgi:rRNA pseudouridine-1189 N-methylase Emg1 (Nep1/Mra1 family)